jgi:heme exporter protein A
LTPSHDGTLVLEARGLRRAFGRVRILHGLDLSLRSGEALVIVGPNGAGKSTLLRLLAGLTRPSSGDISILGESLDKGSGRVRRHIGLLSHQSLLYDDLTLLQNLTFTARLYGLNPPGHVARAALEVAGLADRAADLPRRLSRGLLQRAALARAMLHQPRLLLLDEPFNALDAVSSEKLRADLRERLAGGMSLVVVTHHLAEMWELASRVAVLVEGRWATDETRQGTLDAFLLRYQRLIGA